MGTVLTAPETVEHRLAEHGDKQSGKVRRQAGI